jgi:hypothetical protein
MDTLFSSSRSLAKALGGSIGPLGVAYILVDPTGKQVISKASSHILNSLGRLGFKDKQTIGPEGIMRRFLIRLILEQSNLEGDGVRRMVLLLHGALEWISKFVDEPGGAYVQRYDDLRRHRLVEIQQILTVLRRDVLPSCTNVAIRQMTLPLSFFKSSETSKLHGLPDSSTALFESLRQLSYCVLLTNINMSKQSATFLAKLFVEWIKENLQYEFGNSSNTIAEDGDYGEKSDSKEYSQDVVMLSKSLHDCVRNLRRFAIFDVPIIRCPSLLQSCPHNV